MLLEITIKSISLIFRLLAAIVDAITIAQSNWGRGQGQYQYPTPGSPSRGYQAQPNRATSAIRTDGKAGATIDAELIAIAEADEREAREVLIEALTLQRDALRARALAQPAPRNAEEMLVKAAKIDMKIREEIRKQW